VTITLDVPEDVARELAANGSDLSQTALQSLAVEGYRTGQLSEELVRRLLGYTSRFEVHAFLKAHDTHLTYSETDLRHDLEVARRL